GKGSCFRTVGKQDVFRRAPMDGFTAFLKQDPFPAEAPPAEVHLREPDRTPRMKEMSNGSLRKHSRNDRQHTARPLAEARPARSKPLRQGGIVQPDGLRKGSHGPGDDRGGGTER